MYFAGREIKWTTSWRMQFKVLLERGLKERKHESYSGLKIFQVVSVSILSGLLWWHSRTSNLQDQVCDLALCLPRLQQVNSGTVGSSSK